jgi:predicted TIM-barrel fold metal-dependent hydrolase
MANTHGVQVPNSAGTEPPKLKAPVKAADCHIHIYDPRFPPAVARPANSTVADYRLLQKRMGVSRVVIVTPRNYATDNSVTLDAIEKFGIDKARGVAVLRPSVTDEELERLDKGGVRGLRFTVGNPQTAVVSIDMIEPLAKRIADRGWHVQLNMEADQIAESADMLKRLPVQVVFDHLGKLPPEQGIRHPAYGIIRGMLDSRKAWLKLSGAYLNTVVGPPAYPDATAVAQAYVTAAPERLVWGSDWPHPTPVKPPDDAILFDLLSSWAPDERVRDRILVDNPQHLYGFPK